MRRWLLVAVLSWTAAVFAVEPAPPDAATRKLAFDIFRELVEIDTSEAHGDVGAAARAVEQRLRNAGFAEADLHLAGPTEHKQNLVVRYHGRGAARPILLICHLDVVEARAEDWSTDPFRFIERDGYVYGRGTQDVKSGCAILVATLIRFRQEHFVPARDLILALTADEESGANNGVDWLIRHHRDWIDAEYVLNPDAGGVDAVDGHVVDVQLGASEKLYADYQLEVTNRGGHSSLPRADNAIYALAAALERIRQSPFPVELDAVTRAFFARDAAIEPPEVASDMRALLGPTLDRQAADRLARDARFNAMLRTTCVPTRLSAGHANNALPQRAQALINCRIFPGHSKEEIRRALQGIVADATVRVRYVASDGSVHDTAPEELSPAPPAIRADVLAALDRIAQQMWNVPVIVEMETGASDSIYTNAAGMPSYGVSGIAIDRDDVRAHGRDERLRIAAFYTGLDFYGRLLRVLASTP
jgi:acetylornithine deacetylase/succinyl-diaminopimelate desuccinylase-like protein